MSEKLAARLRKNRMESLDFLIGLRALNDWIGNKLRVKSPTNDGKMIFQLYKYALTNLWNGEGIFQIQTTALNPQPHKQQLDMRASA